VNVVVMEYQKLVVVVLLVNLAFQMVHAIVMEMY
jgi:hypothetical protein